MRWSSLPPPPLPSPITGWRVNPNSSLRTAFVSSSESRISSSTIKSRPKPDLTSPSFFSRETNTSEFYYLDIICAQVQVHWARKGNMPVDPVSVIYIQIQIQRTVKVRPKGLLLQHQHKRKFQFTSHSNRKTFMSTSPRLILLILSYTKFTGNTALALYCQYESK